MQVEAKKYEYIDSLRGIAILLVILVHVGYVIPGNRSFFPPLLEKIIFDGAYGVHLFFIVSALTLMMSHYNRLNESNPTRNFFIRRFFRITPLFYLAIIYFTLIVPFIFGTRAIGETVNIGKLIASFLFIDPYIPGYRDGYVPGGYTISIEFIFYLIVPFLCSRIRNLNSSLIFMLASLVLSMGYTHFSGDSMPHKSLFFQLPVFSFGFLVYWWDRDSSKDISVWVTLSIMFFIFFLYYGVPNHFIFGFALMFLVITLMKRPLGLLSNRVLSAIGKVSYSMYIFHFVIIGILNNNHFIKLLNVTDIYKSLLNFVGMYLLVFIITFIISNITYRLIEVPGQNLGRKLIIKLDQQK